MLKVLFTLDCDFCHEPLQSATVCCDFEPLVWSSCAADLTRNAREQGWSFEQQRQTFLCSTCKEQIEEVRNRADDDSQSETISLDIPEAGWSLNAIEAYIERLEWRGIDIDSRLEELEKKLSRYLEC